MRTGYMTDFRNEERDEQMKREEEKAKELLAKIKAEMEEGNDGRKV